MSIVPDCGGGRILVMMYSDALIFDICFHPKRDEVQLFASMVEHFEYISGKLNLYGVLTRYHLKSRMKSRRVIDLR
jgi:hypothetical protein